MPTLNYIEAIWLLTTLVAFYFTAKNLIDAVNDRKALHPLRNGRLVVANAALRRDSFRLAKIGIFLAIGIYSIANPREPELNPFVVLLLFLPVLLAIDSGLDNLDRRYLMGRLTTRKEKAEDDAKAATGR